MTTDRIGEQSFQAQTDRFGNTRGTIGGRPFSRTANGIGGQNCR